MYVQSWSWTCTVNNVYVHRRTVYHIRFIPYAIRMIYFYTIWSVSRYIVYEYDGKKELDFKVESSNPTHATWCVTLIKWLYPLVLKAGWLYKCGVVSLLSMVLALADCKTLADNMKKTVQCVPGVWYLPWKIPVTDTSIQKAAKTKDRNKKYNMCYY